MFSFKKVLTLSLAALALTACSNDFGSEDSVDSSVLSANASVSRSVASSALSSTVKLTSNLNPGYGSAVYFTGTFNEGNDWTVAVRGSYNNGWYANVTASEDFEWKALTGSYDLGEKVTDFSALTWESGENHTSTVKIDTNKIYVLSYPGISKYGCSCYFTGTFDGVNNWQTAIRADLNSNYKFYSFITDEDGVFEWKALTGWPTGDAANGDYAGLNWSTGDNYTQADAQTFKEFFAEQEVDVVNVWYDENDHHAFLDFYNTNHYALQKYMDLDKTFIKVTAPNGLYLFTGDYAYLKANNYKISYDLYSGDATDYKVEITPYSIYGDQGKTKVTTFRVTDLIK